MQKQYIEAKVRSISITLYFSHLPCQREITLLKDDFSFYWMRTLFFEHYKLSLSDKVDLTLKERQSSTTFLEKLGEKSIVHQQDFTVTMEGNQYISRPRVVQTKYLEQILKSQKDDINRTIMKLLRRQNLALTVQNKCLLCIVPWSTPGHGSSLLPILYESLRQVYKGPVRHRDTAAGQRKWTWIPVV